MSPVPRNFQFTPYVRTGRVYSNFEYEEHVSTTGFDIKYSLTPRLTLDATYNTDFAQVDSDQVRINLGRYSLFFPETRPLFLESLSLFNVGVPWQTQLFHSRRIGVAPNGTRLPIEGGLRLTVKINQRTNLGFMHIRADSARQVNNDNFTMLRVSRDFPERSSLGLLGTHRKSKASSGQTIGLNASVRLSSVSEIHVFVATTNRDTASSDEHAYNFYNRYNSSTWKYELWGCTKSGRDLVQKFDLII